MTARRRVALFGAGLIVLLLVLLASTLLLFRGRIEARVKAAIANRIDARVDWRRLDLAIFRDFPNLTLRLHDLVVAGVGPFEADTLLAVPRFRLVLDLGSVLRSWRGTAPVVIRALDLDRPAARLLVLEDGTANWDIMRERQDPVAASGRSLELSLARLAISGGRISFENRRTGVFGSLNGLQHSLDGDFRQQRFTLHTRTIADTTSLRFAGVPYLSGVRVEVAGDLDVDLATKRFTVRDNEVRINELVLESAGSVVAAGDSVALDLAFSAPSTAFRDILSLVPAVYAQSFATLETSGTMAVSGTVRGGYGATTFPALAIAARVENGSFRYPDLPLPARDVSFSLSVANPGGHVDSTVVMLERLHAVVGSDPLDGSFVLRTPVSDPDVALELKGRLDLANVGRTLKLEGVQELAGVIVADAAMRARQSDLDARRYERVTARGGVSVTGMAVRTSTLPHPLRIAEAQLQLSPQHAELTSLRGRIGSSDVVMSGFLDNLLGFALHEEELRGQATVASPHFYLDEWRSDDPRRSIAVPGNIDIALQAEADTVTFGKLELHAVQGGLQIKDRRATLEGFRMGLLGGAMGVTGFYETTVPARPTFDVDIELSDVDVPAAFAGFRTVQAFAPVARYAEGLVSAELRLNGVLGEDMMPVLDVLTGLGSLTTSGLVLRDFPALDGLAAALKLQQLDDPGFVDLRSAIEIKDGRLHVQPFDVRVGQFTMNVAGSNGIDQSLDYTLALHLPRSALGPAANRAVSDIVAKTARAGLDLQTADVITLAVRLTGTVTNPSIVTSFRDAGRAVGAGISQAVRQEAEQRREAVAQQLDSAAAAATRRASEEAARLIAEAEQRAASIRAEATTLAETLRQEANLRADSLEARPTNAVARIAAKAAADRIRKEADARAAAIVREADTRADALIAEAKRKAGVAPEG